MGHKPAILVYLLFSATILISAEKETITFPSMDGVEITADLYLANADSTTPLILLFHQAGWSRGEYKEIAPKLNNLGFNCIAVDQRSGNEVNSVVNMTSRQAKSLGKPTSYADALPDMESALRYARENHASGKLLAWGSSYSAALVLKLAGDFPDLIDGVLAFAPGEYFSKIGKSTTWIQASAKNISCPVFVASARNEQKNWQKIYDAIPVDTKSWYLPKTAGNHGSRALWNKFADHTGYWQAVNFFLKPFQKN